ncbi:sterol desaturase family protein [Aliiglaciecola sp. LCG003]|uniref:sterol desaturase family protein n=1 Tax=Aliiglaciecola sp. LCG003 TaxID=3053655 RepID=UPI002573E6FC|nr:sterol desaturase family protein [Aliiglaciecola sp. LCG003]WJG09378.1 sterol desaturase family protein [Aliiglaciecola sp. LCG003]
MTIILYAIPFFFLLIALELIFEKIRKTDYYRVNDAIGSLSAGVMSRMIGIAKNLVPFTIYIILYDNLRLFTLPESTLVWVAAFVIYDFFYYWNHRFGHEMSIFWAGHVVHHSSEDYNLTTALRQSSGTIFSFVFYLPMALMGFDPLMLISVAAINLVYQFWVHTQHVPKLGWLEWIFVTPSNHRVHHAQNQRYLDRNYGGVFIIWDRIFASFQDELDEEPPIYGVRKALHSWNPVWANLQVYSQLVKDSTRTKRWPDKFRVWFGKTGWRPDDVAAKYPLTRVDLTKFERFDTALSVPAKIYCVFQYAISAMIAVYLMMNVAVMAIGSQMALAAFVVLSSVSLAWFMESKPIAYWLEWGKNALLLTAAVTLQIPEIISTVLFVGTLLSLFLLVSVKRSEPKASPIAQPSPPQ